MRVRIQAPLFWFCALALALVSVNCSRSTDKVAEARAAYANRNYAEAARLYAEVLEEEPNNPTAMLGLADVALNQDELEQADALLLRLADVELTSNEEAGRDRVRRRYLEQTLETVRGEGPANPADVNRFEQVLLELFNMTGDTNYRDDLIQLLVLRARATMGVADPLQPLTVDSEAIDEATVEDMRATIEGYKQLTEHQERFVRPIHRYVSAEIRQEATTIVAELERRIFDTEFQLLFDNDMRSGLIEAETYFSDRNVFRFADTGQWDGDRPDADTEEFDQLRFQFATHVTVNALTALAYQSKGIEQGQGDPPLQLGARSTEGARAVYSGVEVIEFEISRRGEVTIELTVPYELLPPTARMLDAYLEWRASQQTEGTGDGTGQAAGGTGQGSDGSGQPAGGSGADVDGTDSSEEASE